MRLHVLSDLHLEYAPFTAPDTDADVVVLAGDTAPGTAGLEWARRAFADRPVLYLAGNHEFYGHNAPDLIEDLRAAADGSNVYLLENDELIIADVRFLGCTLWSDFDSAGAERRQNTMRFSERVVNDYKLIGSSAGGPLRAQETRDFHLRSRAWLTQRLAEPHPGPTVVLTHHLPLVRRRPDSLVLQALGGSFASDLTDLIGGETVNLWIHGHNHRQADLEHAGTRVISNPRGYPHQPVAGFDPALVVSV